MCGLAGLVRPAGLESMALASRLDGALARLRPRGPDGNGTWSDAHCALIHTRLAIIDLSDAARQPMERHGYVISFNGEIYNHAALRSELERLGHAFDSHSDTEVLLAGWRQWGEALLPKLSGMFAFAIWDPRSKDLVLATDRFGKKPLVYALDGGACAFASDLKALRALLPIPAEVDQQALKLLFALRYIPAPWTILKSARKLPGGSIARFNSGGFTMRRWDEGPRPQQPVFTDRGEAIAALREVFDRAVLDRLVSDVPVGAFLSGGIDSAIVCASLAAQNRRVRSFTVGFPGAAGYYEERPAARRVADYLGLEHTEVEIDAGAAQAAIEDVFSACDEPFADSSALPVYLLARETRRHVTVALSGDGADEIFAGYRKYQGEFYAGLWQSLPAPMRRSMILPVLDHLPEGKRSRWLELLRRIRRFAAHADKPAVARQAGWAAQLDEAELEELLPGYSPAPNAGLLFAAAHEAASGDPVNRMLFAEQRIGLAGDMLRKVDLMSMANALEVRSPFLDRDVTDVAAAIPGAWKLERGRGKAILRDAFSDRLPPDVFKLPKKGFEMPIADWLCTSLRDRLRAASDPGFLRRQGMINPEPVRRWLTDLLSGRRDTSWQLWTLLAFQAWAEGEGITG